MRMTGKSNPEKEVLVAEIFPDFATLNDRGISDIKSYFAEEVILVDTMVCSAGKVGHQVEVKPDDLMGI